MSEAMQESLDNENEQSQQNWDDGAKFPALEKGEQKKGTKRDLDFLLDIPLEISVELGRTNMIINDLLQLGQGSVVELDKLAGEPLEIFVNHKLVARGEAVVVNDKFGVRITDIISPIERVKQLS
jgi:flagellar motor switch protein FliN/FliY